MDGLCCCGGARRSSFFAFLLWLCHYRTEKKSNYYLQLDLLAELIRCLQGHSTGIRVKYSPIDKCTVSNARDDSQRAGGQ
eukprot:4872772-Amphidinium_carterae.1